MTTLFVHYSPGNIRLMKCGNCKAVADEYIECEPITKAYTHLLYNVIDPQAPSFQSLMWKSTFGFLLLDAYRSLFLERSKEEWGLSMSFALLLWIFQKSDMIRNVVPISDADGYCLWNIMFFSTFVLAMRILFSTFPRPLRYKELLLAIFISSYFKMFLIAMMGWKCPMILIIDLFVSSPNTVITRSPMSRCIAACFSAHVVKFLVT
ncbi:arv1-like protein [Pyrus ussuriensis x Pyrus communis]|uniref:Protein ARV n=1 Tax=Pyrus ussuriensis x Pyrus communis TaxID=2448454 RepID=A0A5N5EZJ1_9ROSA|nr:arv1-like protein [Pyrus ussuriensis x Pyrus communis]